MEKAEAAELVREKLREYETAGSPPLVLLEDKTLTRPVGWVFFYQSRRYVESGDVRDALAGNAPIIVDRDDGTLFVTGTAHPVSHYLRQYETEKRLRAKAARPRCPACGAAFDDAARLDLLLTKRPDDGRKVCKAVLTCGECRQRSWRWNDRPSEPLAPYLQ
jgi:hypothetical protein